MLTSSQINEYHENGYTILPNLLNLEQIKSFISQIEQIINLYDKVFVVFDGDEAGKNATLRVFDKILTLLKLR